MFANNLNLFSKCRRIMICRYYVPSAIKEKEENQSQKLNEDFQNKDKMKDYFREYYLQNKEKLKEASRGYYIQNKEKVKEFNKEYYLENKDKKKAYRREYDILNKEKIKEYRKQYDIKNKDKKKEYYLQNKDKVIELSREYYLQNKEKKKEYYIQNKNKVKEYKREYYLQNKNKMKEYIKKNKDKIKLLNVKKNIERNNGIYIPSYSWKSDDSVREYFERTAPLLVINDPSDWYRISASQIVDLKGGGMFNRFNTLGEALKVAYPEYDWDMSKFSFKGKKSTQRWLYVKLKKLLPNAVIEEEYYHPELLWEEDKKKFMQLDIWVSQYNLALEYQGEHHYYDLPGAFGPGSTTQIFNERDEKKKQLCASKGIHLVCIPYWWDGHEDSLSSTLHTILPDIFHKTDSPPIPANLPTNSKKKRRELASNK